MTDIYDKKKVRKQIIQLIHEMNITKNTLKSTVLKINDLKSLGNFSSDENNMYISLKEDVKKFSNDIKNQKKELKNLHRKLEGRKARISMILKTL